MMEPVPDIGRLLEYLDGEPRPGDGCWSGWEIMLVWWAVRLARYLHEISAGTDRRLAAWPEGWRADIEAKYIYYLAVAESCMASHTQESG
jgi:hypothetical protein